MNPSHGAIAFSDGGRVDAARHCVSARYDTPSIPTAPLLHGWAPAHSMRSWTSSPSWGDSSDPTPSEVPAP
ncbi:hypothetical protein GCM10020254_79080 [Streptomyces goshikiensis]